MEKGKKPSSWSMYRITKARWKELEDRRVHLGYLIVAGMELTPDERKELELIRGIMEGNKPDDRSVPIPVDQWRKLKY